MDFEHTANPYRSYGPVAAGCGNWIILRQAQDEALMVGLSNHDGAQDEALMVSLSNHDGAQFGPSSQENLYLDQQNETFLCAANCYFTSSWNSGCIAGQSCSAIEIGADSRTKVTEQTSIIAQFNQGLFTSAQKYDVYFDNPGGNYCKCRVALGGGMVDVATPSGSNPGQPTTNRPTQLTGQTTYAPPVFANAASVGVPLSLNPNELGVGVSTDAITGPGKSGLKFRVECSVTYPGKERLVVLAGTSPAETIVADNIGGGTGC